MLLHNTPNRSIALIVDLPHTVYEHVFLTRFVSHARSLVTQEPAFEVKYLFQYSVEKCTAAKWKHNFCCQDKAQVELPAEPHQLCIERVESISIQRHGQVQMITQDNVPALNGTLLHRAVCNPCRNLCLLFLLTRGNEANHNVLKERERTGQRFRLGYVFLFVRRPLLGLNIKEARYIRIRSCSSLSDL